MKRAALASLLLAGSLLPCPVAAQTSVPAPGQPILSAQSRMLPVIARKGMVSSQERQASQVGVEILKAGGNAIDAAVATGFALAVTLPRAGNLGGGGFMLVHLAKTGETVAIDYRETAPAASTRDMFLDSKGEPDPQKSRDSGLSIGVPGTVRGLALVHEKYGSGRFTLAELIAPSV
ncbi:MAG: gamma-glutamyltransferase, partial [Rhabdaerophilum sp.]